MFWFVGLIPDLATLRDRSESRIGRFVYGMLAMGWRGSALHWHRYETAYLLLAGLSTPLVVSVHTIVSLDFAVALIPGWHATIFPPYFVAGAIYAGFAMVLTLAIPLRWYYDLDDFITMRHLDNMARVMLATGLVVAYGYMMETFVAWYSASSVEQFMVTNRFFGPYNKLYWALIFCNVVAPASWPSAAPSWAALRIRHRFDRHGRALHHHRRQPHRDFLRRHGACTQDGLGDVPVGTV
jgi:molybdopterin-containing oxidoreductase family membrane subunit